MNNINILKATILFIGIFGIFSHSQASDSYYKGRFFVGAEGGYSQPLTNKFTDEDTGSIGKLKGTGVYEGKIGYIFYDNLAVEISYSNRPSYKLGLDIPPRLLINNIHSDTTVKSEVISINFTHFAQSDSKVTKYFLAGIGFARVTPQESPVTANVLLMPNQVVGKIEKSTSNRLALRLGAGVDIALNDHFSLMLGGKIEVVSDIILNTNVLNYEGSIKKTLGVGEFTAGIRCLL